MESQPRQPIQEVYVDDDEISLVELFGVIWKYRIVTLLTFVIFTTLGVIYALLSKNIYTTTTLFFTKTGGSTGGGNISQLASLAGISLPTSGNVDPSQYLDLIITDQVFLKKLLEKKWVYKNDSLLLEQILEIKPDDTTKEDWQYRFLIKKMEAIRGGKYINIEKGAKGNIMTLSVSMPDPKLAYEINVYTLEYISNYIRNSLQTQAKEKRTFIEERLNETFKELKESENALAQFKERNIITKSPTTILEETRLARQVTINQEIYLQLKKQYELAKIEELDNQTLVQIVKRPEIPIVKSKPKRKLIVGAAGGGGIMVGLFLSFILNFVFSEVKKKENTPKTLSV
ncbi:MAG: Wzz/FepE/Etk N-terminal domain-containing protein [Chitinispirillaceae bacterium]|nr:Wzz/FepE/Etk N-terminal domain-containing protein [Chitinispirillaceae bacterium]